MCGIDRAVQSAKQKHSHKSRIVNRPRPSVNASLQQLRKMIDYDVVDESFPPARTRPIKNYVVKPHGFEISGDTRTRPRRQLSLPIVVPFFCDRRSYFRQELLRKSFGKRRKHVILGRKIKIEGTLRDVSARCNLLDRRRPNALLEKQALRGVHNFAAPLFRRLRPRPGFRYAAHNFVSLTPLTPRCRPTGPPCAGQGT